MNRRDRDEQKRTQVIEREEREREERNNKKSVWNGKRERKRWVLRQVLNLEVTVNEISP